MDTALKMLQKSAYFRKTNYLIEAKYQLGMLQTFLFTQTYMSLADDNIGQNSHKIYFKDVIENFDLPKQGKTYESIIEAAKRLRDKGIQFDMVDESGHNVTVYTGFFTKIRISKRRDSELSYIEVFIDDDLKPHLIQLKRFTLLNKSHYATIIGKLHNPLVIRIYDLLKQYEGIGKRSIDLDKLKDMLEVSDKYPLYGNFKQKVLFEAQKRLAAYADINFDLEEIKEGRSVSSLTFHIKPNTPTDLPVELQQEIKEEQMKRLAARKQSSDVKIELLPEAIETPLSPLATELLPLAASIGITPSVLQETVAFFEENAVRDGLAYTVYAAKNGKIKDSVDGYFFTAVKKGFKHTAIEKEKKTQQKQVENRAKQVKIAEAEQELAHLKKEYHQETYAVISQLTEQDTDVTNRAIAAVQSENTAYFSIKNIDINTLTLEDYRHNPILRVLVIDKIKEQNAPQFLDIEARLGESIRTIEQFLRQ